MPRDMILCIEEDLRIPAHTLERPATLEAYDREVSLERIQEWREDAYHQMLGDL